MRPYEPLTTLRAGVPLNPKGSIMIIRRMVGLDEETWRAIEDLAQRNSDNLSAVVRDGMRAYLTDHGYTFTSEPRRYNRRGMGRKSS